MHLHFVLAVSLFNSLLNMTSNQRYTQEQVETAVELVKSKLMSLNDTSKAFGIPYATLWDKVRGRRPMQPAPEMVLLEDEEKKLVQWLIELSHRGFGRTKDNVKDMVKTILDARGWVGGGRGGEGQRLSSGTIGLPRTGCRHSSKDTQR